MKIIWCTDRIFSHFGPFTCPCPLRTQKIKILRKSEKHLERSSFYTSAPYMTIIRYMVPEMWSAPDRIFLSSLAIFCCFTPLNSHKNENFKKKMIKRPGDTIILHKGTKNHDHRLYCSWDMAHDGWNYFSFRTILFPFTPHPSQQLKKKGKFQKNEKKNPGDIIILYNCTKNHNHMLYCPWDMVCDTCNCSFSF